MDKLILRRLSNSFDAYTYYPFKSRFESFKDKKSYFLYDLTDDEKFSKFQEFIFFDFCYFHFKYQQNKLSKEELKDYYKAVLNNGQMSAKGGGPGMGNAALILSTTFTVVII